MSAYSAAFDSYVQQRRILTGRAHRRNLAENRHFADMVDKRFGSASLTVLRAMFNALDGVRKICRNQEHEQYGEDIELIGDENLDADDVREMLVASGFTNEDAERWFAYADYEKRYVVSAEGNFCAKSGLNWCERYEHYTEEDTNNVKIARNSYEDWSTSACEEYAFYCDVSEQWYYERVYSQACTDDGRTICHQYANENDWYWHEGADHFATYPEDEDEEEDEDDEESIPSYHSGWRNWDDILTVANRSTRAFYGFEIELDFVGDTSRAEFNSTYLQGNASRYFCGERDSSLDDSTGMEIITRPFSLQELRSDDCKLRELMRHVRMAGADGDEDNYGVHVTTNWGRLDQQHKNRMRDMVYRLRSLAEFIARRKGTGYCNYENKDKASGHHTAVNVRDRYAVEFRIFQSTTDYNVLLSYAEFVDAVTEYTRDPNRVVEGPLAASLFRHWVVLGGQYPALAKRFPTPSCKELLPCALPSSNRPIEPSPKTPYEPASSPTLMVADSPSLATMDARTYAPSSTSINSWRTTARWVSEIPLLWSISASPRAAPAASRIAIRSR
jgi:hypothetical protein